MREGATGAGANSSLCMAVARLCAAAPAWPGAMVRHAVAGAPSLCARVGAKRRSSTCASRNNGV